MSHCGTHRPPHPRLHQQGTADTIAIMLQSNPSLGRLHSPGLSDPHRRYTPKISFAAACPQTPDVEKI
eukprot:3130050-Rhodomonas_salina.1